jgi:hypothetical protein
LSALPLAGGGGPCEWRRRGLGESASNWASLSHEETVAELASNPEEWRRFLDHEVAACREPGLLDAGTHILFAARQTT